MRPNIIYLHSHDTGRLLQPYGYAISTPCLQQLAEEGVLFRNTHSAGVTCSPSRAALLTGQSPHSCGMLGLAHRGFRLADPSHHLVHTLRRGGYHSVLAGLQHVAPEDEAHLIGYDEIIGNAATAETSAADFLSNLGNRTPFFLDVGFTETHRRGNDNGFYNGSTAEGDPRYVMPPQPLPDTPDTRADFADFAVAAARLDAKIGVVLDALRNNGLQDQTVVIYTTDHGPAFPNMKNSLTAGGSGVALIMRGPGEIAGGTVSDALVSHLDLAPTLCELADVSRPGWLEGRSVMPLLRGERIEINDEIHTEASFHAAYEPKRAVRGQRYLYIRNYGPLHRPVLPNCDDSLSKQVFLDSDWSEERIAEEELYDTVLDPAEASNLVAEPGSTTVLADMRARLDRWMRRTSDPLRDHAVIDPPPGTIVNDPRDRSPRDEPETTW